MKKPGKWRVKESASFENIFHREIIEPRNEAEELLRLHKIEEEEPEKDFIHTIEKITWSLIFALIAFVLIYSD